MSCDDESFFWLGITADRLPESAVARLDLIEPRLRTSKNGFAHPAYRRG